MTDKERITALRAALKETVTELNDQAFYVAATAWIRLCLINAKAREALRLDDKAEITGEKESA
tara:strand:+ start:170 stop:358 length:189 start_codon:yes stop_codon:yes gene_type:complete